MKFKQNFKFPYCSMTSVLLDSAETLQQYTSIACLFSQSLPISKYEKGQGYLSSFEFLASQVMKLSFSLL